MKIAAQSKGVDRHFLGLRLCLQPGEAAAIFDDPLFARSKYWQVFLICIDLRDIESN